jgi:hypothetical protein
MIIDAANMFTGSAWGSSGGLAAGPATDKLLGTGALASSNIIDLGNVGGIPFGNGRDIGIGDEPALKLSCIVFNPAGNPIAGGTSLALQLQGAQDSGAGVPGTPFTIWTGPAIPIANLVNGAQLANIDMPRLMDGQPLPEFLILNFVMVGTFTGGGTLEASLMLDIDDQVLNPTSGIYSGYPAGLTVAN